MLRVKIERQYTLLFFFSIKKVWYKSVLNIHFLMHLSDIPYKYFNNSTKRKIVDFPPTIYIEVLKVEKKIKRVGIWLYFMLICNCLFTRETIFSLMFYEVFGEQIKVVNPEVIILAVML